jgi:hypothetical protein
MCPLFTAEALRQMVQYFKESKTGWGLDYLWSKKAIEQNRKLGIFDIVSVEHSRAMGKGDLYANLKKQKIDYKKDFTNFMKKYELKRILQKDKKNVY